MVHGLAGHPLAARHQHGRGLGAVLGLGEQVDGDEERVGVLVGDDEDLGRPGEQVDADLAEQLALGLGHVGVAGAGDEVDAVHRLRADGHRGHGLHAAEDPDLVGAGEVHRGHGRGGDLAADRRGAGDDAGHPGDLGGDDGHVRRGGQRVLAARDVGAGGLHGHVPVAEEDPGQRLDLDVGHRGALHLGEVPDLGLHEDDVVDHLLRQGRDDLLHPLGGEPELTASSGRTSARTPARPRPRGCGCRR